MKNKKIVALGRWWSCDSLDLLAHITEQGIAALYTDGTTEFLKEGETPCTTEKANDTEKRAFGNGLGIAYKGDTITIDKGKLKGANKIVDGFYKFIVPNTYGKVYTDYLIFEDGTKTNIKNCLINGKRIIKYEDNPFFRVGGRI